MDDFTTKPCSLCHETKPLTDFNRDAGCKDGLRRRCRYCEEQERQRRKRVREQTRTDIPPGQTKRCSICHEEKPLSEFYTQRDCLYGVKGQCKTCYVAKNNKQRERPGYTHYTYPGYLHAWIIKRKYGMTVAEYDAMYAAQNGVCAICGQPEIGLGRGGKVRRMSTDHDHTTGAIRGLLCHNCNFILGSAHDDPDVLRKAADYLEKHK